MKLRIAWFYSIFLTWLQASIKVKKRTSETLWTFFIFFLKFLCFHCCLFFFFLNGIPNQCRKFNRISTSLNWAYASGNRLISSWSFNLFTMIVMKNIPRMRWKFRGSKWEQPFSHPWSSSLLQATNGTRWPTRGGKDLTRELSPKAAVS